MSTLDPETRYDNLSSSDRVVVGQFKKGLNTALPGIVHAYDPATRRATVQPAIDLLKTDGTRMSQPLIPNVPVVWPSAGQWTMAAPLAAGDPVLLVISQRGLTDFKRRFQQSAPDVDRIMSLSDAVAIPGFGPTQITPASEQGIAIQSADGAISLTLEPDGSLLHNGEPVGEADGEFAPGPTAPANLRNDQNFGAIQRLVWDAAPSPSLVARYDVQYRRAGTETWLFWPTEGTGTFAQWTTARIRGLVQARVRAYNTDGIGPWSSIYEWTAT